MTKRVAGILLAAGASQRLGRPKQLLEWNGQPLIAHAARTALAARLDPVIAVIGYRAGDMRAALLQTPVTLVENPRWPEGMSTSLHAGVRALPAEVEAAIMLLVDQPRISPAHLRAIVEAYQTSGKRIVSPAFQGRRASPTLFDRSLFEQLLSITGDTGGRSIVTANPHLAATIEIENELDVLDIDTLEDWQRIASNGHFSGQTD
ncbi:MAG TPA: nucleotidyltransferase family protein [Anaerolineae bacterium]|nr:nucleotidyltransferase family protein [Anaerolineae bacterium]